MNPSQWTGLMLIEYPVYTLETAGKGTGIVLPAVFTFPVVFTIGA